MAKTLWLIWDGASYPLIMDLLQRGVLPHVQRLVTRGGLVPMRPSGPNTETPPGLMTLFAGCEEADHGVPGYTGPLSAATRESVTASVSGFDARWLRRPPVWVDVAAAQCSVSLITTAYAPDPAQQTPYSWPYPTTAYRCVIDGYNREIGPAQLVHLRGQRTQLTLGQQTYEVRQTPQGYTLEGSRETPVPFIPYRQPEDLQPLWLDRLAGIGTHLAWLQIPSSPPSDWLWCSAVHQWTSHPPQPWLHDLGPFLGAGIGRAFSRGQLGKGPRLPLEMLQSLTCNVARFFGELAVQAITQQPADLMLCYQPAIDEIAHQLMRDALADWPAGAAAQAMIAIHRAVDHELGRLLDRLSPDDTLFISSDHGHEPIQRCIRPNVVLRQAGLLSVQGDKVDLERTRAVFHSSGWVLLNTTDRAGGIVSPSAYEALLAEVAQCLDEAVDPVTQLPLGLQHSRHLWDGEAPAPGDLFLWGPPEYELRSYLFGAVCGPPDIGGNHQTALHPSPYLQAILAGCGPGWPTAGLPTRNSGVAALVRRSVARPAAR